MRVALSTYADVKPTPGLAVQLRTLGAEAQRYAPPDFAERLGVVPVPLVPTGAWR